MKLLVILIINLWLYLWNSAMFRNIYSWYITDVFEKPKSTITFNFATEIALNIFHSSGYCNSLLLLPLNIQLSDNFLLSSSLKALPIKCLRPCSKGEELTTKRDTMKSQVISIQWIFAAQSSESRWYNRCVHGSGSPDLDVKLFSYWCVYSVTPSLFSDRESTLSRWINPSWVFLYTCVN